MGAIGRSEITASLRVLLIEASGRDGQRLLDALQGCGQSVIVGNRDAAAPSALREHRHAA